MSNFAVDSITNKYITIMERILKHYDKECTMTLVMDYTDYITLMNCLKNHNREIYSEDAELLFDNIEESNFKVIENTEY